ncbi:hypothetical protein [Rufibacter tibetensis]|uniref:Uncharacterized protein n=1 Tax=Rufibacter tibetensis TaxID=512763 RepID=A0A0P0CC05_9BACT|nr:hypothetical protein [Rufibacter tibetensis]ALI99226.1 hypothetical protein DC20_09865 [Rufibacter tibetensis]
MSRFRCKVEINKGAEVFISPLMRENRTHWFKYDYIIFIQFVNQIYLSSTSYYPNNFTTNSTNMTIKKAPLASGAFLLFYEN